MKKTALPFNNDLEVLRGVAISFTLCSHLVWGLLPKFGAVGKQMQSMLQFWTGVDLFFAISGFIITSSLSKTAGEWRGDADETGVKNWRGFIRLSLPFWIRRVFRLLPSAWLWIAITLLLTATCNTHVLFGTLHNNLHEAGAALLNIANFYYYETFSGTDGAYGSFGIFWSLSLEEQFYLLLPFLLFFSSRRFFVGTLCVALLAQIFVSRPDGFNPHHTSLLWFIRTDALILGVLIALWRGRRGYRLIEPRFMRQPFLSLPLVGLGILMLAVLPASSATVPISTGLAAVVSGLLVLIASYNRDYILRPSWFKTAMVWLGARSYGIYLIHVTCHTFVIECKRSAGIAEGGPISIGITLLCLPLILLLAEANHRLIETPFRRLGKRIANDAARKLGHRQPTENAPLVAE